MARRVSGGKQAGGTRWRRRAVLPQHHGLRQRAAGTAGGGYGRPLALRRHLLD